MAGVVLVSTSYYVNGLQKLFSTSTNDRTMSMGDVESRCERCGEQIAGGYQGREEEKGKKRVGMWKRANE